MSRRAKRLCPTPSKKAYWDEEEAVEGGRHSEAQIERSGRTGKPFFVYRCDCRRYHLTHHSMAPDGRFLRKVSA